MNESYHSGFCAVIGRPNVGKSTLLNQLIGQRISIISEKAQTTRNRIRLIYTDARMQIVFLDTPGIQQPKNELGEAMLRLSKGALDGADLIILVVDTEAYGGRLDAMIDEVLESVSGIPVLLALNKIDRVSEEIVRERCAFYEKKGRLSGVCPISAAEGTGVPELLNKIYEFLPPGPQYYPEEMITDRPERFVVAEFIREQCLHALREEIPHGIYVSIEQMKKRPDRDFYDIDATIVVEKDSHKGMVIGKGGAMLRHIGTEARRAIEPMLGARVNLQLWVKVEKNWRKKKKKVDDFGFEG
uniref:GTPase Era n=1 Tax=Ndongobacter massiliensis TaxID=1871025 RepID=UPI0009311154|nr:GTPase Era [Ndongobacter massiliensis]